MIMNPIDLNVQEKTQLTDVSNAVPTQKKDDRQKIKKACKDFEAIFAYYILKTMRQTVPKSSSTSLSNISGKDTYNMLMDQKVAEELSKKGDGLGLQKMLFEQLTKNYPKEEVSSQKIK
jgi:peptidoglycan hydrolase FlgJ